MEPILMIRIGGELVASAIKLWKAAGAHDQAQALADVLAHSDATWGDVKRDAEAALAEPPVEPR